jgi:hypothetical protein
MYHFDTVTIAAAANKTFGAGATDNELKFDGMKNYSMLNIGLDSATDTGVATITFNMGNGSIQTETQNAGTMQAYLIPGCVSFNIAIATENTTVRATLFGMESY